MKLIVFPGDAESPSHSPFCIKAMCLLEMAGQEWEPEYILDLSTMPLGKVPVLRVGDRVIPDSHNIQAYLEEQGADFNAGLGAAESALSHALVRMVEENLRLGLVHDRWLDEGCWSVMQGTLFAAVPDPMRESVAQQARAHVRAGLESQGIARFSPQDRLHRLGIDIHVLGQVLGDKRFLFGDRPSAADAAIAPVLEMILRLPEATDLRNAAEAQVGFAPYVARVRDAIYPSMGAVLSAAE